MIHRWEGGGRTVFVNIDRWFVHDMLATDDCDAQPAQVAGFRGRRWFGAGLDDMVDAFG